MPPLKFSLFTFLWLLIFLHPCRAQHNVSYYIEQASSKSPLIQDYQNQSEAARFEGERLKAFYLKPQLSLNGAYMVSPIFSRDSGNEGIKYNDSSPVNYNGYDLAISNSGLYMATLNYSQPLFNNSRYQMSAAQTDALAQSYRNNAQLSIHDLEKVVTDQYILCLQDQSQVTYLEGLTSLIQQQQTIVQSLVKNGILKQSDLILLNIEYKSQLTALNTFRASYQRDLMDLNVLSGINDTTYTVLSDLDLLLSPDVGTDSKYLIKFQLDSLNLIATQNVFDLKYKPQVSVFASAGLNAVNYRTISQRFGMNAGINFTWYLFDGHQKKLIQEKTTLLLQSTQSYKNMLTLQNRVRKSKTLTEIKMAEERLELLQSQMQEYNDLLGYYRQELMQGQIPVINYINTLKNAALTNRDYLLLQTSRQLLINTYNYWNW